MLVNTASVNSVGAVLWCNDAAAAAAQSY